MKRPIKYNASVAIGILLLFHIIGLALFLIPNDLEQLSGWNMVLCALLVFSVAYDKQKEALLLLGIVIGGFLAEAIGVNTGWLFGNYEYGEELGAKVYGVPVVLGLNWYCVVAAASNVVLRYWAKSAWWIQVLLGAMACVALDYLIEPVAMKQDFWSWENGLIPMYNYVCWFFFSLIFVGFYLWFVQRFNPVAYVLFWLWALFFLILNFF